MLHVNHKASYIQELIHDLTPHYKFNGIDLSYIQHLTNHTAILQHAIYTIPDYKHGYCLDDAVRALMLVVMAYEVDPRKSYKDLINTYLAYISYMQRDNGQLRNFLSFDHQFLDEIGTEDSYGRTIWSMGFFLHYCSISELKPIARQVFDRAIQHSLNLRSVRAVSYALLGIQYYNLCYPNDTKIHNMLKCLSKYLRKEYERSIQADWNWYEQIIAYDNAIIPLSVLRSAEILKDPVLLEIGQKSAIFLDEQVFSNEHFSPIGNYEWYMRDNTASQYGQQPIEVPSSILLYKEMHRKTQNPIYEQRTRDCFLWYFGKNDLNTPLYNPDSKGCFDGLESYGVNKNQGAESAISFWTSYFCLCYDYD